MRLCECFPPPDDSCFFFFVFSLEFDSRIITAVLVDHGSKVLEPVFCFVTEQQMPSTIHQCAQVDEIYRTKFLLREFLATAVPSINRHKSQRWHNTYVLIVSSTAAASGSRGSTRARYVQHQPNYYMRQAATQQQLVLQYTAASTTNVIYLVPSCCARTYDMYSSANTNKQQQQQHYKYDAVVVI